MPSPFDQFDAAAQAAIDTTFGEGIRIEPMAAGNYAAAPDPSRPARMTRATISRAPAVRETNLPGTNRRAAAFAASPIEAWIDRAAYAAIGYRLVKGDVIVLIEQAGEPRFHISAAHPGDERDVTLALVSITAED
jgi:hypothetical protein